MSSDEEIIEEIIDYTFLHKYWKGTGALMQLPLPKKLFRPRDRRLC